jgi:MFS family permease
MRATTTTRTTSRLNFNGLIVRGKNAKKRRISAGGGERSGDNNNNDKNDAARRRRRRRDCLSLATTTSQPRRRRQQQVLRMMTVVRSTITTTSSGSLLFCSNDKNDIILVEDDNFGARVQHGTRSRRTGRRRSKIAPLRAVSKERENSDNDIKEEEERFMTATAATTMEENERMIARTSSEFKSRKEVPSVYGIPRDTVLTPLAGLLVSQLVLYIGVGVLLPALPLYAQSIGLSQSANGLVISAPALAMLILNVPTGQMADRYGRKPVMIAGLGIMAVADIGTALAKTMVFLIPTRLLLGVGRAACEGGDRAYLADLTKRVPEKRGIITAAQAMVHGFGLVIGPLIGGSALDEYGPATAFYVVGLAAVGTAIGYAFLPETLSESERSTDEDFFGSADDDVEGDANNNKSNAMPSFLKFLNLKNMTKRDKKSNLGKLLKDPDQRLLLTCAAANSFGFVAKLTVIPLFASGHLHATSLQVGELFSLTALLGLATAPVSGLLSDAIGKRWVLTGSLALCALGLAVGSGSEDLETLRLAVGCWGIGCAAAGPAVNALAQEIAPKGGEGESLTLPKTAADIVFLVGPIILGGANDLSDSEGAGILITAAIAGVAAVVCAYGAVTYKKKSPQRFGGAE